MAIERMVPVFRVTDIDRAVAFYCLYPGFRRRVPLRRGHNGPTYVGACRSTATTSTSQPSLATASPAPRYTVT